MSDLEFVSVLGNRNLNAVCKHGSLNKPMSHGFLLNPVFLRLLIKINYDHGRGPNGRGP